MAPRRGASAGGRGRAAANTPQSTRGRKRKTTSSSVDVTEQVEIDLNDDSNQLTHTRDTVEIVTLEEEAEEVVVPVVQPPAKRGRPRKSTPLITPSQQPLATTIPSTVTLRDSSVETPSSREATPSITARGGRRGRGRPRGSRGRGAGSAAGSRKSSGQETIGSTVSRSVSPVPVLEPEQSISDSGNEETDREPEDLICFQPVVHPPLSPSMTQLRMQEIKREIEEKREEAEKEEAEMRGSESPELNDDIIVLEKEDDVMEKKVKVEEERLSPVLDDSSAPELIKDDNLDYQEEQANESMDTLDEVIESKEESKEEEEEDEESEDDAPPELEPILAPQIEVPSEATTSSSTTTPKEESTDSSPVWQEVPALNEEQEIDSSSSEAPPTLKVEGDTDSLTAEIPLPSLPSQSSHSLADDPGPPPPPEETPSTKVPNQTFDDSQELDMDISEDEEEETRSIKHNHAAPPPPSSTSTMSIKPFSISLKILPSGSTSTVSSSLPAAVPSARPKAQATVPTVTRAQVTVPSTDTTVPPPVSPTEAAPVKAAPPKYTRIEDNEYLVDATDKKIHTRCICTEGKCLDGCLNYLSRVECGRKCKSDECQNNQFQKKNYAKVEVFNAGSKGFGLRAVEPIKKNVFLMEYVGEVIDDVEAESRLKRYSKEGRKHHYLMKCSADVTIDATIKGNETRFMNHSCDPNAFCDRWIVQKKTRIGFFTTREVAAGEELTFDYQFSNCGKAQMCYCGASNCKGKIGEEAEREEGADDEMESESEESEAEEEMDVEERRRHAIEKEEKLEARLHEKIDEMLATRDSRGERPEKCVKRTLRIMISSTCAYSIRKRIVNFILTWKNTQMQTEFITHGGLNMLKVWLKTRFTGNMGVGVSHRNRIDLTLNIVTLLHALPIMHDKWVNESQLDPVIREMADEELTEEAILEDVLDRLVSEVSSEPMYESLSALLDRSRQLSMRLLRKWEELIVYKIPKKRQHQIIANKFGRATGGRDSSGGVLSPLKRTDDDEWRSNTRWSDRSKQQPSNNSNNSRSRWQSGKDASAGRTSTSGSQSRGVDASPVSVTLTFTDPPPPCAPQMCPPPPMFGPPNGYMPFAPQLPYPAPWDMGPFAAPFMAPPPPSCEPPPPPMAPPPPDGSSISKTKRSKFGERVDGVSEVGVCAAVSLAAPRPKKKCYRLLTVSPFLPQPENTHPAVIKKELALETARHYYQHFLKACAELEIPDADAVAEFERVKHRDPQYAVDPTDRVNDPAVPPSYYDQPSTSTAPIVVQPQVKEEEAASTSGSVVDVDTATTLPLAALPLTVPMDVDGPSAASTLVPAEDPVIPLASVQMRLHDIFPFLQQAAADPLQNMVVPQELPSEPSVSSLSLSLPSVISNSDQSIMVPSIPQQEPQQLQQQPEGPVRNWKAVELDGDIYYYHKDTRETLWDLPEGELADPPDERMNTLAEVTHKGRRSDEAPVQTVDPTVMGTLSTVAAVLGGTVTPQVASTPMDVQQILSSLPTGLLTAPTMPTPTVPLVIQPSPTESLKRRASTSTVSSNNQSITTPSLVKRPRPSPPKNAEECQVTSTANEDAVKEAKKQFRLHVNNAFWEVLYPFKHSVDIEDLKNMARNMNRAFLEMYKDTSFEFNKRVAEKAKEYAKRHVKKLKEKYPHLRTSGLDTMKWAESAESTTKGESADTVDSSSGNQDIGTTTTVPDPPGDALAFATVVE